MSSLKPGARLEPYEVGALLGAGGMGEVYRARDPKLGSRRGSESLAAASFLLARLPPAFRARGARQLSIQRPRICMLDDIGCDESLADETRLNSIRLSIGNEWTPSVQ